MKKVLLSMGGAATAAALVGANASAAMVITPAGAGSASGYQALGGIFDAQPATVPVEGETTDDFGAGFTFYQDPGRGVYIDFGVDHANYVLTDIFMGLTQWGWVAEINPPTYFFSAVNNDVEFDASRGDILAPDLNLVNFSQPTGAKRWGHLASDLNLPVSQRYLIIAFDGPNGTASNRMQELVFVGTVIPEPASVALVGLGALGLLGRRRAA